MHPLRSWPGFLGTLTLACLPAAAGAQPVGSEFQINTYTTSSQRTHSNSNVSTNHLVAADANGNFVVVWRSRGQDGAGNYDYGIFGQRYDSSGAALGSEFHVNSFTITDQQCPSVAAAAAGDFVVVWGSYSQNQNSWGIFGQRYDSAGDALGNEFRVNSHTPFSQNYPSVASDASGNFVVVWHSDRQDGSGFGIFGQRYDSAGGALGSEFRVNSHTPSQQRFPSVASGASGNFVVVWNSLSQDGNSYGIFGQRYDSAGGALGSEFRVNTYTPSQQRFPAVASDASGNFVVVWQGAAGSGYGIFGQRYDSAGGALGSEFPVNSFTTGTQVRPSVASDASWNFVVAWTDYTQDGSYRGVFGRRFDSAGDAQGDEFQINSYTTDSQRYPSVGATGLNRFVVVWESRGQDGDLDGVFGQGFDFGSGGPTIHVGDLDRRAKNVGASWRAQVKTLVHDDGHSSVSGVLVSLDVSGVGARTCTTTAVGSCEVSVVVSDNVPSLTFTVTNLSKAGFSYDAGANHDPDGDSNGTVIVVNQP